MTTHILIDGDIVAYQAAARHQDTFDWGEGEQISVDEEAAKAAVMSEIDYLMGRLWGDRFTVFLSDDLSNWRKKVLPTYKSNRTGERPEYLYPLKAWMRETLPVIWKPHLEADDLLGVWGTEPDTGEDRIVVSLDKDLMQIPGMYFRPGKMDEPIEITPEAGDRWHMVQTLAGDPTDGYKGCPGIGYDRAYEFLDGMVRFVPQEREIKRGPRKGTTVIDWVKTEAFTPWEVVTGLYARAGLSEDEALVQARVSRILRHGELANGRPVLWTPPAA